ncbi:helix-turn-helix domain-containing protein [Nocardia sp. NPDC004654]|uniref:PucR family transcriptional regulator n=1 Tax=Nocardia sp. NPDC004654 TaxID=3154776 RepID=UPI0033BA9408
MTSETIGRPEVVSGERPSPNEVARMARDLIAYLLDSVMPCKTSGATAGSELTFVVRTCMEWVIDRLNGHPSPEGVERIRVAAAGWAHEGIPIDTVLHIVHEGFKAGIEMLLSRSLPRTNSDAVAAAFTALELLRSVTATIGKAYVRECKSVAAQHHSAIHTLTSALLGGHATSAMARECGIRIAEEYFVLAVSVPAHPDESRPAVDGRVVARRKLRRLQAALAHLFGDQALALLSVDGGTVLVATTLCRDEELVGVVETLSEAARVPITAAVVVAGPDEVSAAADRAHELLDTAAHLGLEPGLYRFTDLALQHQLNRPGLGRDVLADKLAVLDEHPDLLETLEIFIANDLSRQKAARRLRVHANTVDYRLRRIGQLTGFDPGDARGLWQLRSALVARADGVRPPRTAASVGIRTPA